MMNVKLIDGSVLELPEGTTVLGVAKAISEGLARNAVAGKVNGVLVDLSHEIKEDADVAIVTLKDKEGLDVYRHTTSHVLAQAVKSIYPTCSLAIGP
ncbi:MAG: TGS domain-containing protein, partial [Clostridia bacterium]|nr:TGS domain-containing protein [Clostridia bacterium]